MSRYLTVDSGKSTCRLAYPGVTHRGTYFTILLEEELPESEAWSVSR